VVCKAYTIIIYFIIRIFSKYYKDNKSTNAERDGACGTYKNDEKCTCFVGKPEYVGINSDIIKEYLKYRRSENIVRNSVAYDRLQ
jgi:hypothetical protein